MKTTTMMMTLLALASASAMASDRNYVPPKTAPLARAADKAPAVSTDRAYDDHHVHFVRHSK